MLRGLAVVSLAFGLVGCSSFFFQAEEGMRDTSVTGVQTCALPILEACAPRRTIFWTPGQYRARASPRNRAVTRGGPARSHSPSPDKVGPRLSLACRSWISKRPQIGRASCRDRGMSGAIDDSGERCI